VSKDRRDLSPRPRAQGAPAAASDAGASDRELFLLRLRYREGRLVTVAGNKPILLDDPDTAWVVYSGHVEVFVVRVQAGEIVGARSHLFRVDSGGALFGMDLTDRPIGLLASAAPGTQLVRVRRPRLAALGEVPAFAPLIAAMAESWVSGLSASLVRQLPPREFETLEAGQEHALAEQGVARTRGKVLWVRHLEGSSRYLGRADLPPVTMDGVLPLAAPAWLEATSAGRLTARDTGAALADKSLWAALDQFGQLALVCLEGEVEQRRRAEQERLAEKIQADRARLDGAYRRLAAVLAPPWARSWVDGDTRDSLYAACRLVGQALGLEIKPARLAAGAAREAPLRAIARASGVRTRRVALRGAWWRQEGGPLVGYREADNHPVALLPVGRRGYELHDPATRTRQRVTAAVADTLSVFADTFYRPFERRPLNAGAVITFGLQACKADLWLLVLTGLAIGILGILTPIVTGSLFSLVIPGAHVSLLLQLGLALVLAAGVAALFQVVRDLAVLRVATKMQVSIEPALIDRLLELPVTFFREYSAGDLTQRALGIGFIREMLMGPSLSLVFSAVFGLPSFVLMFFYDARLAAVASGLVALLLLAFWLSSRYQIRYQRRISDLAGRLAGTVLQLINGLPKLRVAGAEDRAFAFWASRFAEQRQMSYQARLVNNALTTFTAAYPVLVSMVVFYVMVFHLNPRPAIGDFMAFNTALTQFTVALLGLTQAFSVLYQVLPAYERARPILTTLPEVDPSKTDPGELSGAIEVDHVSFRYQPGGPLVLDDVSLHCRPGEFIALVGPSGSGKSTLLRLLLGFDTPEAGAILYDGRDLATLDIRAVRRQIGSVLQNGRLMSGDIFTNIVGSSTLTLDDAWEAARMAGLEEDIKLMPMGMNSYISEGGGTLSGGQRQRLMIARAIVTRPRILFFDEATSALDNRTQEIVSQSLQNLAATRVVIAHRLSTIVNADRIYVLQHGRVVETGTYRELMQRRGVFAQLARRQIA
jgi:NHLM bacteriocin system ABC transporter ATP-binding protein